MKVGINGFGRIGRMVMRELWRRGQHRVTRINELNPDVANMAYMLRHDSNAGKFPGAVAQTSDGLTVADATREWRVRSSCERHIDQADWSDTNIIIEASGVDDNARGSRALAGHVVEAVIVTQHWQEADLIYVPHTGIATPKLGETLVIAASTCDANAIAPVLAAINSAVEIERVQITTLHPWLSYQNLCDGSVAHMAAPQTFFPEYGLGRASAGAIIPKSTTAGTTVEDLVPDLRGRVNSMSFRVPTPVVGYADLSLHLLHPVDRQALVALLEELAPLVQLSDEPLVSVDIQGETFSALIDLRWLSVAGPHAKVVLAYDNEAGYAARIADIIDLLRAPGVEST
jgi:glyceraldehyde 3-phosphate dehydrogenase